MTNDEEAVCRRLAQLSPELPIDHAADVIAAIADGNIVSLCCDYNVSQREARVISWDVWSGIPVYQAVAAYLDRVGVPR